MSTDRFKDDIKAFITISRLLDSILLKGFEELPIADEKPLETTSINSVPLDNVRGTCTIGFIKSQLDRKHQLAQKLESQLNLLA